MGDKGVRYAVIPIASISLDAYTADESLIPRITRPTPQPSSTFHLFQSVTIAIIDEEWVHTDLDTPLRLIQRLPDQSNSTICTFHE